MEKEKIAITGIGVIAPRALNKDEFWSNIISKRNCIIEVPKDRWDPALYYDPDPKARDKTYSKIGGFIENFKFDPLKYRIPPASAAQIARLQQMTIEAVMMALEDAKYDHAKNDPKRTGVVIANAMGAQRKELTDMRVYKFLNEDIMMRTGVVSVMDATTKKKLIEDYEKGLDEQVINITEDTMPGELANVTSGRIANIFNFNGPSLTLDAACASSFAALDYAIMALRSRKVDVVISGGADEMMSPAAYVKFCKIGALSPDGSWVFDTRANGFVMAEAVGIYVLKRLSDAIRDGDRIYALINSVGASSDGKGKGITAPNPKGQKIAIENAFAEVDYAPGDVDFVECHGTATRVGDAIEIQVLKEFFGPYLNGKKMKVTSVKSQIGHSKAAAGSVSLIKTALAMYNKTLPPSANFQTPNPSMDLSLIEVITEPEKWESKGLRRANVSSFGFGGTNFHVTMEEYTGHKPGTAIRSQKIEEKGMTGTTDSTLTSNLQPLSSAENPRTPYASLQGEALTLTANSIADLARELDTLYEKATGLGERYPLSIISVPMNMLSQKDFGISITAKSPKDLIEKIDLIRKSYNEKIFADNPLSFKLKGIYAFNKKVNYSGKIGFLFPGQGSQYVDMMRDLAAKYDVVQDTFNEADRILEKMIGANLTGTLWSRPGESKEELEKREAAIKQTQMTQPAMMTADMAMFRLLTSYGIKPDMAIGHSLGEYAAATAAGIFTLENGLRAVTSRAKEMSNIKVKDPGKMASVAWDCDKVEEQLKKINGYVIAANKNCPIQTVIAGERTAVEEAVKLFQSLGVQAQEIAVSHAFHSAIIEPAIGPYREFLQRIPIKSWNIPILSNVTADFFPKDTQGIYDMLVKQMVSPVQFINQINRMYAEGVRVFIECGPKRVLSAFVATTLEDKKDIFILSSNHPKRGGIFEYNDMLANMMTMGFNLNWQDKFPETGNRFYNPYYLNWALSYDTTQGKRALPAAVMEVNNMSNDTVEFAKNYGFNFNPIAVSGIAGGAPGTWGNLFRENSLDEILEGKNMIEPIPHDWRKKQINKNVIRVIKSDTGNHRIEPIDSIEEAIKLSARKGNFDIEKEFGIPPTMAKAMNDTFRMAVGAGILALKDAGLPLVRYYKKTTTGGWLPEKWALPEPIASETGVIFASAFPTLESVINEVTSYFMDKHSLLSDDGLWEVYENIVNRLRNEEDKKEIRKWMRENLSNFQQGDSKGKYTFSQNFLLKVIPIADSQFAQWVGAKGPAIHISAACASTTQAVNIAETWIRCGKCKRVVIISADDITNETQQEWTMPGFLSSGTATTEEDVKKAALPFDNRRHGLIVGSAAMSMVIEDETLVRGRGMVPLARLLLTEVANSAFHVTRLDTDHVSQVMSDFITKIERIYGLTRKDIAPKAIFISHETYTPKRGGSASAEVKALKKAFGEYAGQVIVSNVKGFTGHTMGAALEDVIAIRALNTGIVPPIANYKEPDPELAGINLSKGGRYDFKYSIRFAAGFGSHMAMSFAEKVYSEGEKRVDEVVYKKWLESVSGYENPETEVVMNTLRIKDNGPAHKVTSHKAQVTSLKSQVTSSKPETGDLKPAAAVEHKPSDSGQSLTEDSIKAEILNMISEKTGYPKDMLDLDLDMEADLGIDTVKQAELFAMMREHFGISGRENLSLKDYPTIRHCVRFVLENKSVSSLKSQVTGESPKHQAEGGREQVEGTPKEQKTQAAASQAAEVDFTASVSHIASGSLAVAAVTETEPRVKIEEIMESIRNKHPKRHFRYVPTIVECPVKDEIIRKFDSKRPAVIIGENMELIKLYKHELSKLGITAVTIASQKNRMRDLYSVNFDNMDEVDNVLKEIALKYPDIQGIVYLMGCMDKALANDSHPFKDMKRYAIPLFLAVKYFNKSLNDPREGNSTFAIVVSTLDGAFGYATRESYDPVYAAIFGITLCMRKELDKATVKLIDFPKNYSHSSMVKKSFYEIQYSDTRLAVCYNHNKRCTMLARPSELDNSRERYTLKGKRVMITGGGRGLGSLFARIVASRWKPAIVILDIIDLNEMSAEFAAMSAAELEDYKKTTLWTDLKSKLEKATPAILEKEFTKIKDSAALYKTLEEIKALGSKVEYHRCDLNDAEQFNLVMAEIKTKSRLDGVFHFAGMERSKLIADKSLEEFFMIFNTKAQSAIDLWRSEVVKDNGFWVMVSSIAGKFGNLGQSDYAAASDYISKFAINLFNQGNRAFSIDMTGIANIGMGVRPGVEAFLKSQNMEFLYPEEVMNALADEIAYGDAPEAIFSGDLGKLDWDKQLQYEPNYPNSSDFSANQPATTGTLAETGSSSAKLHFMEKVERNSRSAGFLAVKRLSLKTDHYLADHSINGTPVFPGVMGIETFAETVKVIVKENPTILSNIRFQLPIKLLKNNPIDIRIISNDENGKTSMRIESDFINSRGVKMGETRIHFMAEYDPSAKIRFDQPDLPAIKSKYKLDSETIYKTYFHGPSFRVLDGVISADKERVLAVFKRPTAPLLGGEDMNYIFHPMLIEAMFQTCGWRDLYLENKMTLPDAIGEISIADNDRDADKLYTLALFKGLDDYGKSIYDSYAFDENGKIFAQLKDYVMIPTQI